MLDDHPFALCLTHDVDRPYKNYRGLYRAVTERRPYHLRTALPGQNPYWRFEDVMALEEELGVRSAFYFLREDRLRDRPLRTWLSPRTWRRYAGRYSLSDPDIVDVVRALDAGGWEVGLHGSFESYTSVDRLRDEKAALESVLGHPVVGGRQHYLNLEIPETWHYHARVGLRYDASLGSSTRYGFHYGYRPLRPFDDEFVVFPLTVMESALLEERDERRVRAECERLLAEAAEHGAVMTVLWHQSCFSDRDYPGYGEAYRRLVERALEMGAWVGPPGDLYDRLDLGADRPSGIRTGAR
jgi:hypothetical protein